MNCEEPSQKKPDESSQNSNQEGLDASSHQGIGDKSIGVPVMGENYFTNPPGYTEEQREIVPFEIEVPQEAKARSFLAPLVEFYNRVYAKPRPWPYRIICYIWYALSIILFASIVLFPVLPHTRISLSAHEQKEFFDTLMKLMEVQAPGSTQSLTKMMPSTWNASSTKYNFYFNGVCATNEGKNRTCISGEGEKFIHGIMRNIGNQMAELVDHPNFSSEWMDAFVLSLKQARFGTVHPNSPYAYLLIRKADNERVPTDSKAAPIAAFVFFAIHAMWEAISFFLLHNDEALMPLHTITLFGTFITGEVHLFNEALRYQSYPKNIVNFRMGHGEYFPLIICRFVWIFLYLFSIWGYHDYPDD